MILSKLITANNLEAIAAPEMNTRATVRRNEAVFRTVDGAKSEGSEYASAVSPRNGGRVSYNQNLPLLGLLVFAQAALSAEGETEVGSRSWLIIVSEARRRAHLSQR